MRDSQQIALFAFARRNGIPLNLRIGRGFDRIAVNRGATQAEADLVQSRMQFLDIPDSAEEIERQFAEQLDRVLRERDGQTP